jgi:hypothetical protein
MRIAPGAFDGVFLLDVEPREDERGFFARTFCADEVSAFGMNNRVAQVNLSFNRRQGTLRGLHFQKAPHGETKIVRCTRGRVFDVIVDLRRGSPTFRQWEGIELSESSRRSIYIPLATATTTPPSASAGQRRWPWSPPATWPSPPSTMRESDVTAHEQEHRVQVARSPSPRAAGRGRGEGSGSIAEAQP